MSSITVVCKDGATMLRAEDNLMSWLCEASNSQWSWSWFWFVALEVISDNSARSTSLVKEPGDEWVSIWVIWGQAVIATTSAKSPLITNLECLIFLNISKLWQQDLQVVQIHRYNILAKLFVNIVSSFTALNIPRNHPSTYRHATVDCLWSHLLITDALFKKWWSRTFINLPSYEEFMRQLHL